MKRNPGTPGERLSRWSYWKGYSLLGFEMPWRSTGDPRYLDFITRENDPFVDEQGNATLRAGRSYVTGLVNAIMKSPDWNSTAIFLAWDDWGSFYDHVVPHVDANGHGLRVPGWSSARMRDRATSTTSVEYLIDGGMVKAT